MHRHSWIGTLLPHRAALLRAPFVKQIILEDWLLDQPI
jgi:[acyl-carrier-protein] S-malonyltransferase